ncbi:hypothetical protein [Priestia megaterium]|uniref:hypothetical protein n=1 Tax=Priestia megaterium TaxID=1404 RepID=UPI002E1EA1E2|nr:hypothetical protein [Priestia megaterium]
MEKQHFGAVYRVTNTLTGEFYVGASKETAKRRLSMHKHDAKRGRNSAMAQAIRKHGIEAFTAETVAQAYSAKQLRLLEEFYFLEGKLMTDKCINSGKFTPYEDNAEAFTGANNPNAKLTKEQIKTVVRIKGRLRRGQAVILAKTLGVGRNYITQLRSGAVWQETVKQAKELPPLKFSEALLLLEAGVNND